MSTNPAAVAVASAQIIVCAGSGGVGKTTMAAALAVAAACKGRRTAVLTIDPARRLADAMGLEDLGNEPAAVEGPWRDGGSLAALMLDTRLTFDALVTRYAADQAQTERILANRFYQNIAGALSGTQEYMANEKLYELTSSGDYDLIVVDTPPTRNALDFLDAPAQLARMLDHRVYRVLTAPGRGVTRLVGRAAQSVVRLAARVVGAAVIDDAIAFFAAFEGMEQGFRERSAQVRSLLDSPATAFILVASPRSETVAEAEEFARRLQEQHVEIRALIVNRVHPRFDVAVERLPELRDAAHQAATPDEAALWENLADLVEVAGREEATIARLAGLVRSGAVLRVPLLDHDVADLAELVDLAERITSDR